MPRWDDILGYVATRPASPFDRMQSLDDLFRTLAGKQDLTPSGTPSALLAAGNGSAHWAETMARQFPGAAVVQTGEPARPRADLPANLHLVTTDPFVGLPFEDLTFDHVHQQVLRVRPPVEEQVHELTELCRVLRPGGRVQLIHIDSQILPAGRAVEALVQRFYELAHLPAPTGPLPPAGLGDLLRAAGMVSVSEHAATVPLGEWGGQVGETMLSNFLFASGGLASAHQARFGIPMVELLDLAARSVSEIEAKHSGIRIWFATGRRPNAAVVRTTSRRRAPEPSPAQLRPRSSPRR